MAQQIFKYTIQKLIDELPKSKTTEWVATELEREGIKQRTFFSDKALLVTDERDIPGKRLLIYSKFFGVDVADLFNYTKRTKPAVARTKSGIKNHLT